MRASLLLLRDEIDAALALIARLDAAGLLGAPAVLETAPAADPPQEPQERVEPPGRAPATPEAPLSPERATRRSAKAENGAALSVCAREGCGQTFQPRARKIYCSDACRTAVYYAARDRQVRKPQNGTAEPAAEPEHPPAPALEAADRYERPCRGEPVPDHGNAAALKPHAR